ncbi:Short-chain dehydrogenase [Pseudomonas amygdali pv. hibisci]|uniref:Short-chain dehydrogenase n=1 Tax=Pseudomonas amygdali pv. hibisci TaxID=251723 RepID=A0AB34UBR2_PSEA0|nr:Short-chain dehydrogenase [Pseudomonas amygdali pv. hibisci]
MSVNNSLLNRAQGEQRPGAQCHSQFRAGFSGAKYHAQPCPRMAGGSIWRLRWVCWPPAMKAFRTVALEPEAIARALVYAIEQPDGADVSEIVVRLTGRAY